MRMFLWHKPLADCKHCSPEIVLPFPPRGGARVISFFLLLCNKKSGTISACRSKKAAQRFCWTASVPSSAHLYHTTSFRQNQHNFVQICPSLSNLRSKALHPQANFHRIRKLSVLCSVLFHAAPCDTTWYRFYDFQSCTAPQISHPPDFQVHPTVYKYIIPD